MRHHQNEECTTASRRKYEHTHSSGSCAEIVGAIALKTVKQDFVTWISIFQVSNKLPGPTQSSGPEWLNTTTNNKFKHNKSGPSWLISPKLNLLQGNNPPNYDYLRTTRFPTIYSMAISIEFSTIRPKTLEILLPKNISKENSKEKQSTRQRSV